MPFNQVKNTEKREDCIIHIHILTSHVNFVAVDSTDVAFVNSITSPDNKLALASLKSKFEFVSSCCMGRNRRERKKDNNYSPYSSISFTLCDLPLLM